jgi:hypothetical protein
LDHFNDVKNKILKIKKYYFDLNSNVLFFLKEESSYLANLGGTIKRKAQSSQCHRPKNYFQTELDRAHSKNLKAQVT